MGLNHREMRTHFQRAMLTRVERVAGGLLLAVGAVLLVFDGLLEAFRAMVSDPTLPIGLKLAVLALTIGLLVMLFSVFREQMHVRHLERYRDVDD